ncbi:YadA-like family protein [Taylorella asinigenitalis]|uniref:YadA-like family protein n=1 Tax=Taylorella asinigenitalis TaxID=84590 RepID=UPI0005D1DA26|nr:YadA-like family protein [Taylorella asinigenitalis]
MNKIYKSVFNATTGAWVAVSELSKKRGGGKSTRSKTLSGILGTILATGSLFGFTGYISSAQAYDLIHPDQYRVYGCGAPLGVAGDQISSFLCGGAIDKNGNWAPIKPITGVGWDPEWPDTAHHVIAIGFDPKIYTHLGVVIGGRNQIHSLGSVVLGYQSVADREYLGEDASVTFNPANKVYLYNSPMVRQTIRGKMGAFSVGLRDIIRKGPDGRLYRYSGVTRQIINVAPGRQWSDAVNVAQLLAVENALKKYVDDNVTEIEKQLDNPIDKPDYTGNENHNGSTGDDKPDENGVIGGELPEPTPENPPPVVDPSDNPGHDNPGGNTAGPDNPDDPNNPDSPFNPNNPSGPGDNPNPGVTVAGGGVAFKFKGNTGEDATSPKANSVVHIKGADAKDGETLKEEDFDDGENILTKLEKFNNDLILRIKLRKNFNPQSITVGKGDPGTPGADGVNGEIKVINKIDKETVVVKGDEYNGGVIEIYGPNGKDGRDGTNEKDVESGLTLANDGITFNNIPGTKSDPNGEVDGKGDSSLSMTADTSDENNKTPGTLDNEEGKPVTPRLVYTDPNNNNEKVFVATMNDGFRFGANTGETDKNPLATKLNSIVEIKGKDLAEGADTETLWNDEFDQGENIMTRVEEKNGKTIIRVAMRKEIATNTVNSTTVNTNTIVVGKGDPGTPGADGQPGEPGKNGVNGEIKVINKIDKETVVVKGDEENGGVIELYGPNGKDGRDGKDGKPGEPGLTLTSKDITFHNIPVTKGKDGKDGTGSSSLSMDAKGTTSTLDDKEGEPKTPRIVYTDPNNPNEKVEVATMKDGLIFSGDNGDTKLKNKLNTELKLVGGADINNVSENNISVAAVPATDENPTNEIKVRLSKDLKGLNSAQFVNGTHETIIKPEGIVISKVVPAENDSNGSNGGSDSGSDSGDSTGSGNGATVTKPVVEINENGLDLKGEGSITGLKPSSDPNSATTLGQVQEIVSNSEVNQWRNTRESTATAVAMANLPQAYVPGKSMVAIAGGNHEGKAAVAVGISTISSSGKWVLKGSMAKSKSKFSAGVGVGYQW